MKFIKKNTITLLLCFLIIFIPFREIISFFTSGFVKVLPDLLIAGYFVVLFFKKKLKIKFGFEEIALLLFLCVSFISTVLINDRGIVVYLLELRSMFVFYILYYILKNVKDSEINFSLVKKVLLVVAIILALFSFVEIIFNKAFLFPKLWANSIIYSDNFARAYSLFNNPNTFGIFLIFTLVFLYLFNKKNMSQSNVLIYVLLFIALLLSSSRSAIIALVLFFASQIKYLWKNKKIILRIFVIVCLSVIGYIGISKGSTLYLDYITKKEYLSSKVNNNLDKNTIVVNNEDKEEIKKITENINKSHDKGKITSRIKKINDSSEISNSINEGRLAKVIKGFKLFKSKYLLGYGFGSFGDSASLIKEPTEFYKQNSIESGFYSDNEYIKFLVETGIIGTLLFALFIITFLIKYIKEKSIEKVFVIFCIGFLGLFMNIFEIQIAMLFFVMLLKMKLESESKHEKR